MIQAMIFDEEEQDDDKEMISQLQIVGVSIKVVEYLLLLCFNQNPIGLTILKLFNHLKLAQIS